MEIHISRSDFRQNPDGSWSPIRDISLGDNIKIGPSMSFRKGVLFNGVDIAKKLE